jgi:transposase InsO family protein
LIWKAEDVSEQRLKFAIRASSGQEEMKALCKEFEISRPTGYVWLGRYRECERLRELAEKSRRPHRSPNRTEAAKEQRVIALRQQYPDWGARKIVELLKREQVEIPRITVHRILLRHGLVRDGDRHRAATQRFERESPNQLWQMDFKGMPPTRAHCLPLVILDDHSRYLVGLFETAGTKAEPVRQNLTTVFQRAGLPEAMLMDHGTPWWNMQSYLGWTWLTVWLMKQGIRLYLSGYRHPQTQGKIERCNGSLEAAMMKRPKPEGQSWQAWLDAYRQEHNHVRPHEALQMEVPATRWNPSPRTFQAQPKPWDYPDPTHVRQVRENGGVSVGGHSYFIGRAFIGEKVQLEYLDDRTLVWFCRTLLREIDLRSGTSHPVDPRPLQRARTRGFSEPLSQRGLRPCDPLKPKTNPFLEEQNPSAPAPPV